jgi:hypothetical protein
MGTAGCFSGDRVAEHENVRSPPTNVEVKNSHYFVRLHGAMLNSLRTGITLPINPRRRLGQVHRERAIR